MKQGESRLGTFTAERVAWLRHFMQNTKSIMEANLEISAGEDTAHLRGSMVLQVFDKGLSFSNYRSPKGVFRRAIEGVVLMAFQHWFPTAQLHEDSVGGAWTHFSSIQLPTGTCSAFTSPQAASEWIEKAVSFASAHSASLQLWEAARTFSGTVVAQSHFSATAFLNCIFSRHGTLHLRIRSEAEAKNWGLAEIPPLMVATVDSNHWWTAVAVPQLHHLFRTSPASGNLSCFSDTERCSSWNPRSCLGIDGLQLAVYTMEVSLGWKMHTKCCWQTTAFSERGPITAALRAHCGPQKLAQNLLLAKQYLQSEPETSVEYDPDFLSFCWADSHPLPYSSLSHLTISGGNVGQNPAPSLLVNIAFSLSAKKLATIIQTNRLARRHPLASVHAECFTANQASSIFKKHFQDCTAHTMWSVMDLCLRNHQVMNTGCVLVPVNIIASAAGCEILAPAVLERIQTILAESMDKSLSVAHQAELHLLSMSSRMPTATVIEQVNSFRSQPELGTGSSAVQPFQIFPSTYVSSEAPSLSFGASTPQMLRDSLLHYTDSLPESMISYASEHLEGPAALKLILNRSRLVQCCGTFNLSTRKFATPFGGRHLLPLSRAAEGVFPGAPAYKPHPEEVGGILNSKVHLDALLKLTSNFHSLQPLATVATAPFYAAGLAAGTIPAHQTLPFAMKFAGGLKSMQAGLVETFGSRAIDSSQLPEICSDASTAFCVPGKAPEATNTAGQFLDGQGVNENLSRNVPQSVFMPKLWPYVNSDQNLSWCQELFVMGAPQFLLLSHDTSAMLPILAMEADLYASMRMWKESLLVSASIAVQTPKVLQHAVRYAATAMNVGDTMLAGNGIEWSESDLQYATVKHTRWASPIDTSLPVELGHAKLSVLDMNRRMAQLCSPSESESSQAALSKRIRGIESHLALARGHWKLHRSADGISDSSVTLDVNEVCRLAAGTHEAAAALQEIQSSLGARQSAAAGIRFMNQQPAEDVNSEPFATELFTFESAQTDDLQLLELQQFMHTLDEALSMTGSPAPRLCCGLPTGLAIHAPVCGQLASKYSTWDCITLPCDTIFDASIWGDRSMEDVASRSNKATIDMVTAAAHSHASHCSTSTTGDATSRGGNSCESTLPNGPSDTPALAQAVSTSPFGLLAQLRETKVNLVETASFQALWEQDESQPGHGGHEDTKSSHTGTRSAIKQQLCAPRLPPNRTALQFYLHAFECLLSSGVSAGHPALASVLLRIAATVPAAHSKESAYFKLMVSLDALNGAISSFGRVSPQILPALTICIETLASITSYDCSGEISQEALSALGKELPGLNAQCAVARGGGTQAAGWHHLRAAARMFVAWADSITNLLPALDAAHCRQVARAHGYDAKHDVLASAFSNAGFHAKYDSQTSEGQALLSRARHILAEANLRGLKPASVFEQHVSGNQAAPD
jgi:uncharacterized lipoprotein YmbA